MTPLATARRLRRHGRAIGATTAALVMVGVASASTAFTVTQQGQASASAPERPPVEGGGFDFPDPTDLGTIAEFVNEEIGAIQALDQLLETYAEPIGLGILPVPLEPVLEIVDLSGLPLLPQPAPAPTDPTMPPPPPASGPLDQLVGLLPTEGLPAELAAPLCDVTAGITDPLVASPLGQVPLVPVLDGVVGVVEDEVMGCEAPPTDPQPPVEGEPPTAEPTPEPEAAPTGLITRLFR